VIELANITKRFGPVVALSGVSLRAQGGEVLGLLGENGAGKSTLMNVLYGLVQPDEGEIKLSGEAVRVRSPRDAQRLGIGMVHQHFKLVPTLSVIDNLRLANKTCTHADVEKWLGQLRWELDLAARVEMLSVGQQQRVEILKALMAGSEKARVLVLDEPTAVLTPQETEELFAAIKTLRGAGAAVIFISHKLHEVTEVCDRITILRRGEVVFEGKCDSLSAGEMAEKMVGAKVALPRLERAGEAQGETVLGVERLSNGRLRNATLTVRRGEIVGVAGVDGNGQRELVEAIVGAAAIEAGAVTIAGETMTRASIRERMAKVAFIADDRHREATILPLSVQQNLMLKDYRDKRFSVMGWLRFGAWREHSAALMQRFDVRAAGPGEPLGRLSGGNQQKVVLARELHGNKPLVVAVNPTRGLDVGATAFVMRELLAARARGAGVLLVHSDLDELLAISDRVLVLHDGTLTASDWPACDKQAIGRLMLGLAARGAA